MSPFLLRRVGGSVSTPDGCGHLGSAVVVWWCSLPPPSSSSTSPRLPTSCTHVHLPYCNALCVFMAGVGFVWFWVRALSQLVEGLTGNYVACLGAYRALYIIKWIYKAWVHPGYVRGVWMLSCV